MHAPTIPTGAAAPTADDPRERARLARERACLLVSDTLAELMGFWNFKPSMGRVWAVLYLSREPLDADAIAERTGLSAGSVSMTLAELQRWGVIRRVPAPRARRRHYEAETDIVELVTRVLRERELRLVEQAVDRFEEAMRILDEEAGSSVPDEMIHARFLHTRVESLARLARAGRGVVQQLVRAGLFDLGAIRDALPRRR